MIKTDLNMKCCCGNTIVYVKMINGINYYKCSSNTKHFSFTLSSDNFVQSIVLYTSKHDLSIFTEVAYFKLDKQEIKQIVHTLEDVRNLLSDPDQFLENYLILG